MPTRSRLAARRLAAGWATRLAPSCRPLSQQVSPLGAWREATDEVKAWSERVQSELLTPLNVRLLGPLERREFPEAVPLPFVLLLGNHSSGKSSFINHVLGRTVQQTGVAPTDDGFTVIAPAARDADRDGASFVGDPSMGFSPLRAFGPGFLSHFKLKLRKDLQTKELMLVDSPGMIDSPEGQHTARGADAPARHGERGYDFLGVTRWLAEQADVVLLFFDPDKPGTTGETLGCLTHSLAGLEHKTHIVLNKVDTFAHIHDFARAYGALCWNLSKVIPRKDLPRIYTMFLPPHAVGGARKRAQAGVAGQAAGLSPLALALAELDHTREELIEKVHCAPERRIDNLITSAHVRSSALLRLCLLPSPPPPTTAWRGAAAAESPTARPPTGRDGAAADALCRPGAPTRCLRVRPVPQPQHRRRAGSPGSCRRGWGGAVGLGHAGRGGSHRWGCCSVGGCCAAARQPLSRHAAG